MVATREGLPLKILITGITGMLGQALENEAQFRGHSLVGLAQDGGDYRMDITDLAMLERLVRAEAPDVIIHTAANTNLNACEESPGQAYLVNARPVATLSEICMQLNIYLIHISTDHYYSSGNRFLHDETSPIQLLNEYARSKYTAEAFALTNPTSLVLRTNIVGFRGRGIPTFIEWAIEGLRTGVPITLFDDFYTSSIDVKQFSRYLFDLLPSRPKGILNLAAREVCDKKTFVLHLAERLNFDISNVTTGSVMSLVGPKRANCLGLDVSVAECLLGYNLPTTLQVIESIVSDYHRRSNAI